jgi:myo-inositol-1(or 4)-monophosphatase
MPTLKNFSKFTQFTIKTSIKAGRVLMKYFGKTNLKTTRKAYNDIATEADKASEEIIISEIKKLYPNHSILAEESGEFQKENSNYRWIIDPLDGTTNFKHNLPIFCVSIALEIKNEIHCGAIYNPFINELFFAQKGKGAYKIQNFQKSSNIKSYQKIKVSNTNKTEFSVIATGFPPKQTSAKKNLKNFNNAVKKGYVIRRFGSAATDLCYTACGRFDAFWELGLKPWDIAAGILIVEEAGGKITDGKNKKITLNSKSIVASNNKIHKNILEIINK